jgi:hypothetical protein
MVEADTPKGHNVDGVASLRALEARHGALPANADGDQPLGVASPSSLKLLPPRLT